MSRETVYHAVILKKQAYGDADEIITFFTLESGRVRGLAKSVKLSQSKLQNALQGLFYVRISLAHGSRSGAVSLKKIIRAEVLDTFMGLRGSLEAMKAGMFAAEAIYKATADEHKNPKLFKVLLEFLRSLNAAALPAGSLPVFLAKFQISLLESLGFAVRMPAGRGGGEPGQIYFTVLGGGFTRTALEPDRVNVSTALLETFRTLHNADFIAAASADLKQALELNRLLGGFLEYQLERQLHSRKLFLA